jgi:hypothetical protein
MEKAQGDFNKWREQVQRNLSVIGGGGSTKVLASDDVAYIKPKDVDDKSILVFNSITKKFDVKNIFVDEDDMASNSDVLIPTQQSVKAYVDMLTGNSDSASDSADQVMYAYIDQQIDSAELSLTNYIDQQVDSAEQSLINYIDSADQGIYTYVDQQVDSAELSLTNYINQQVDSAEQSLIAYVDQQFAAVDAISTDIVDVTTTPYSAPLFTKSKLVLAVDTSTTKTINIADLLYVTGQELVIKDATGNSGTNEITINAAALVDNQPSATLKLDNGAITLIYHNDTWRII